MLKRDDFDEERAHARYSALDPSMPSYSTTDLKNRTGAMLELGVREPVELTSHGRPRAYLVPAWLMRKFLMLEDWNDAEAFAAAKDDERLGPEESEAFLASLGRAPVRIHKKGAPRARKPAAKRPKASQGSARRPARKSVAE